MTRSAVSIESIRTYFDDHPESLEPMLFHNPRYIFFDWGDDRGPRGSIGQVLTPQRSVALDHDIFPTGAIGYLISRRPVLDANGAINHWKIFGRFVLPQDSGAAIKGAGRVDLFMGSDYYAEKAAGHMNEPGSLFFLLPAAQPESKH
jgi:membrane-bound lytic murein transglycosylase A